MIKIWLSVTLIATPMVAVVAKEKIMNFEDSWLQKNSQNIYVWSSSIAFISDITYLSIIRAQQLYSTLGLLPSQKIFE